MFDRHVSVGTIFTFIVILALVGYNLWHFWGGYQDRDIYEMMWHGFWASAFTIVIDTVQIKYDED